MTKLTITVRIDKEFCARIREIQSDEMNKRNETFSFSDALEIALARGLDK